MNPAVTLPPGLTPLTGPCKGLAPLQNFRRASAAQVFKWIGSRFALGFQVRVAGKFAQGLAAASVAVLLSGCASSLMDGLWGDSNDTAASSASTQALSTGLSPDMTAATENAEVAKLYNEGLEELASGQNKSAVKKEIRRGRAQVPLFELCHQGHPDAGLCQLPRREVG